MNVKTDVGIDNHLYPEYYDAYSIEEIYGYEPIEHDEVEPELRCIQSKHIESFKQLIEPLDGLIDSAWPMYCHDVRHTGRSPYSTAGNVGFNKWWYKTNDYIEGSAAIDKNGIIYFGGTERDNEPYAIYLYALYPNGTMKWRCEINWFIEAGPAIAEDGTIYVGDISAGYGILYAINPNGTIKWKFHTYGEMYSSPVIGSDGTIYVGDGDYYINAINPNGTLKWRYKTGLVVYSSPAIGDDGTVYCGSHDNYLYAFYPDNGTLKWKYKLEDWVRRGPCIGDDGTIYVASLAVHALYPNGTLKWKTNFGSTTPTIGQDGTVYCGLHDLYALNPDDGSIKWKFDPGPDRVIQGGIPCNSADGIIYIGTHIWPGNGGEIIAINPDGTERWRERIANKWCEFAPVIGEDGTVYIGSSTEEYVREGAVRSYGYLYAFNEMDPSAPSAPDINGPGEGFRRIEYNYTFKSISPLGNKLFYWIDWDDGDWKREIWIGPYDSGEEVVLSHSWSNDIIYTIKARVKDSDNLWSDWSEFSVNIKPRSKTSYDSFFMRLIDGFPLLKEVLLRIIR